MTVSAEMFTPDFLEVLREHADPEADDPISAYFEAEGFDAEGVMEALIRLPVGSDEHSEQLRAFVEHRPPLPSWADKDLIARGQELFGIYLPQFGMGLWMASIPSGYAGARDAIVLEDTTRLVSDPKRRFIETGQFVLDVMSPGGLAEDGAGSRDIRHVRLMHATSRHLLLNHPELNPPGQRWSDRNGVPINQLAMLATQFTFSLVGLQALERSGVRLDPDDAEAYVHLWNVVGHQMGVRSDLLPLDRTNAEIVWARIKKKEYAPSPQGTLLTASAIEAMQSLLPGDLLDGLPATGMRELLDPEVADLLDVPRADWTRVVFIPERLLGRFWHRRERESPIGRRVSAKIGRLLLKGFIDYERAGGRQRFEVDDQLRKRFKLS